MVYSGSAKWLLIIAELPKYFQAWNSHQPEWDFLGHNAFPYSIHLENGNIALFYGWAQIT